MFRVLSAKAIANFQLQQSNKTLKSSLGIINATEIHSDLQKTKRSKVFTLRRLLIQKFYFHYKVLLFIIFVTTLRCLGVLWDWSRWAHCVHFKVKLKLSLHGYVWKFHQPPVEAWTVISGAGVLVLAVYPLEPGHHLANVRIVHTGPYKPPVCVVVCLRICLHNEL